MTCVKQNLYVQVIMFSETYPNISNVLDRILIKVPLDAYEFGLPGNHAGTSVARNRWRLQTGPLDASCSGGGICFGARASARFSPEKKCESPEGRSVELVLEAFLNLE